MKYSYYSNALASNYAMHDYSGCKTNERYTNLSLICGKTYTNW